MSNEARDAETKITDLRSQYPSDLIGLPAGELLLSFTVQSHRNGATQLGYEIESATDPSFSRDVISAKATTADSQWIAAPATVSQSRQVRYYRVRIETEVGLTDWSQTLTHEAGLLQATDWVGVAIGDEGVADGPAALLRRSFAISKPVASARLFATAQGAFDLMINGKKVGDHILAPGWTPYQNRIINETHDVTAMLQVGENAVGALLGDGWWRGKFGFLNMYNNYGEHTSLLAQLEIEYQDGSREVIATDETWRTATGGVQLASIYDGCTLDFTKAQVAWCKPGFDDSTWVAPTVRDFDKSLITPLIAPPVRVKAELPVTIKTKSDRLFLDAGQNIAGWLRVVVNGKRGQTVIIRHAEVLEPNDVLHTKALRGAKAIDTYVLGKDGEQTLEPKLTFHGFQYADVVTEAEVISATAIAITSDNADRSSFESSHQLLNKLHSNVLWSQRDNFVSIPTDCPQRDERLGWTGDAQAFIYAANTLIQGDAFFRSWLRDLASEQGADGNVPMIVPDLLAIQWKGDSPFGNHGTAGWGDAATVIPWALYETYGDKAVVRDQLDSMRGWVDYFTSLRTEDDVFGDLMQLGDWLDPDAPEDKPFAAKVSGRYMASAYMAHSARILSSAEALVGDADRAAHYKALGDKVAAATWNLLGAEAIETTTGCSIALEFDIAPKGERATVAAKLAEIVRRDNGRISTGFLGTPVILDALSKNGHTNEAYLMLLRTEIRSWLYPITVGATTIWERWEAIKPDGTISGGELADAAEGSEGSMISFNHYAYGAVIDWVYRNVAGLQLTSPGYQTSAIAPRPVVGIDWAKATIATGYGELSIDWKLGSAGSLVADIVVPFGTNATLDLPVTTESEITVNDEPAENLSIVSSGKHTLVISNPLIATL